MTQFSSEDPHWLPLNKSPTLIEEHSNAQTKKGKRTYLKNNVTQHFVTHYSRQKKFLLASTNAFKKYEKTFFAECTPKAT